MFKDRRPPDDFETSIDETRQWLTPPGTDLRSAIDRRAGERRRVDRRGHTNTARRTEDAERNQHRRALLVSFLGTLSHDDLLLWIDRLWLGHASEPQLDALVASVRESPHFAQRIASRRASRRPRAAESPAGEAPKNAWLSAEWRNLSEQLTVFASLRRQHHAAGHEPRFGTATSSQYRDACLASPIGTRVSAAELFDEFFDRLDVTPAEMAARLLQREVQSQLRSLEPSAGKSRRGLGSFTAVAAGLAALALFPKWRTLYRGPRDRPPTSPADPRG